VPAPNDLATALLYRATREPLGLWITTPEVAKLKWHLYNVKRALNDPTLDHLTITHNPLNVSGELWVLNRPPPEPADDE